jgi:hypothetical protein
MVNVGVFYDHLENFIFGIVCGHLLYFFQSGMFGPRKIRQPFVNNSILTIRFICKSNQHYLTQCVQTMLIYTQ